MIQNLPLGPTLLIAGTAIGGGMLALPLSALEIGFLPSIGAFGLTWFFMTLSAAYLLQACLRAPTDSDLFTVAHNTLGNFGKWLTTFTYFGLLYTLICAYILGLSEWTSALFEHWFNIYCDKSLLFVLIATLAWGWLALGTKGVDYINRFFMILLCFSYALLIGHATPHLEPKHWEIIPNTLTQNTFCAILPVLTTAFGFGIVIPMLCKMVNKNQVRLKAALFYGCGFVLIVYIFWQALMFGLLPIQDATALLAFTQAPHPTEKISQLLVQGPYSPFLAIAFQALAFSALITSFLGVSISLAHFLKDAIPVRLHHNSPAGLGLLTMAPALLVIILAPYSFLFFVSFASLFVAILLGILPVLFAQYSPKQPQTFTVPGGCPLKLLTLLFFICVISIELYTLWVTK